MPDEGVSREVAIQRLTPMENTIMGFATGAIDITSTQWILYCKNATQQGLPLTLDPRVLYRGYTMSLANMMILTGAQVPLTGMVKNAITQGEVRRLSDGEELTAALTGGVISGFLCAPMELIMIQQQRYGTSLIATPAKIVSEAGSPLGLFRGLAMSCGREGIFTMGMLGLGPVVKRQLVEQGYDNTKAQIYGGIAAGVVVGTISHPMDTIKTCQQGDVLGVKYTGIVQTYQTLMSEAGAMAFFRGWAWRTGRMCFEAFLWQEIMTQLSPILFPHHFKDVKK